MEVKKESRDRKDYSESWKSLLKSSGFHQFATFLIFVVIAALFWVILALNDNMQQSLDVRVEIENVPDTVTFIDVPPAKLHVMVRDKGTSLLRNGVFTRPALHINFRDYADRGIFRVNRSELNGALKSTFGATATIVSSSLDSLRLNYTALPGKRVPVDNATVLSVASGKIIRSVRVNPQSVLVYSTREILDTIHRVYTERASRSNLDESTDFDVHLRQMPGIRMIPDKVKVSVEVEPLVRKRSNVAIKVNNAPEGVDLLLLPPRLDVEYYLPMADFNAADPEIDLWVDYREVNLDRKTVPVHIGDHPSNLVNLRLPESEVEYVIVHE